MAGGFLRDWQIERIERCKANYVEGRDTLQQIAVLANCDADTARRVLDGVYGRSGLRQRQAFETALDDREAATTSYRKGAYFGDLRLRPAAITAPPHTEEWFAQNRASFQRWWETNARRVLLDEMGLRR